MIVYQSGFDASCHDAKVKCMNFVRVSAEAICNRE